MSGMEGVTPAATAPPKGADGVRPKVYTDSDGTVMEWDETQKAYFPKVQ